MQMKKLIKNELDRIKLSRVATSVLRMRLQ